MMRNWPILFVVVPLLELYLIIKVGSLIGAFWTVLLVLVTAVIGIRLLRHQGLSTLARARQNMARGVLPASEMLEGMLLAIGGAFLITPGFITDTLGFLCLIPATRRALVRYLLAHGHVYTQQTGFSGHEGGFDDDAGRRAGGGRPGGRIIEGECRRED